MGADVEVKIFAFLIVTDCFYGFIFLFQCFTGLGVRANTAQDLRRIFRVRGLIEHRGGP
jgi:hypothetical protein